MARLFRALTRFTQEEFAELTGIHPSSITHYELGTEKPGTAHLEAMARVARITVEDGIDLLRLYESRTQPRLRPGRGPEALLAQLGEEVRSGVESVYHSLLRLPLAESEAASQRRLDDQMALLRALDEPGRLSAVRSTRAFQTAALADRVAAEATEAAPAAAAAWARLAKEIARLLSLR